TTILAMTPSSTASYSMVALSVSISAMTSPVLTASPSFLSHLARLPFSIVGDSAGMRMLMGMSADRVGGADVGRTVHFRLEHRPNFLDHLIFAHRCFAGVDAPEVPRDVGEQYAPRFRFVERASQRDVKLTFGNGRAQHLVAALLQRRRRNGKWFELARGFARIVVHR